jgi:hypothetical protein
MLLVHGLPNHTLTVIQLRDCTDCYTSATLSMISIPNKIMAEPSGQQHGATRNQRTWSTTATVGSQCPQSHANSNNGRMTDASTSNTMPETSYSIQRWLTEKSHEGSWNGLMSPNGPMTIPVKSLETRRELFNWILGIIDMLRPWLDFSHR